jgi:hypothetical protein
MEHNKSECTNSLYCAFKLVSLVADAGEYKYCHLLRAHTLQCAGLLATHVLDIALECSNASLVVIIQISSVPTQKMSYGMRSEIEEKVSYNVYNII